MAIGALSARQEVEVDAPAISDFSAGDLVWAKSVSSVDPFWPGQIVDPVHIPEDIRWGGVPGTVCVMFFGSTNNKSRGRDYLWARQGNVLAFTPEFTNLLKEQTVPERFHPLAFAEAIREALQVEFSRKVAERKEERDRDQVDGRGHLLRDKNYDNDLEMLHFQEHQPPQKRKRPVCTSCGAKLRQARDESNDGGRTLCQGCEKLFEKGQLGCDTCEKWVHECCDPRAEQILNVTGGEEIDYFCPECSPNSQQDDDMLESELEEGRTKLRRPRSGYFLFSRDFHK
eukprot:gene14312-16924_t